MANETIQLRAQAKTLGIDGYRKMSTEELKSAIKRAKGTGSKPAVTPSNPNGAGVGTKRGTARKSARKSAVKTKTVTKKSSDKSARKSTARKSSVKSAPATSAKKSGTAKRSASRAGTKAANNGDVGRVAIDNASIDWTAESRVGNDAQSNRGIIMRLLRKHKGNVTKVKAALADKAQSMYPKTDDGKRRTKGAAIALLSWHVSRIKFDFVKDTGQHNGVTRSGGSSSARKPSGGSKSKTKAASRQKPAQSRKSGTKKKSGTAKSATKRTSARSRKRK